MDALKFVRERNRMCKFFGEGDGCMSCPFYREGNRCRAMFWSEEIIPIVEKWSEEHPYKTRQSEYLKQWPKTRVEDDGIITLCPLTVSSTHRNQYGFCKTPGVPCDQCRREFWMQEVE